MRTLSSYNSLSLCKTRFLTWQNHPRQRTVNFSKKRELHDGRVPRFDHSSCRDGAEWMACSRDCFCEALNCQNRIKATSQYASWASQMACWDVIDLSGSPCPHAPRNTGGPSSRSSGRLWGWDAWSSSSSKSVPNIAREARHVSL